LQEVQQVFDKHFKLASSKVKGTDRIKSSKYPSKGRLITKLRNCVSFIFFVEI